MKIVETTRTPKGNFSVTPVMESYGTMAIIIMVAILVVGLSIESLPSISGRDLGTFDGAK